MMLNVLLSRVAKWESPTARIVAALGLLLIKANSPKVAPAFKEETIYQLSSSASTDVVLTDFNDFTDLTDFNVSGFDILLESNPSIILISFEHFEDYEFLSPDSTFNPYNT